MKRWGLRASFLSADTKADAGQKPLHNHLNPNVLYRLLGTGDFCLFISLSINFAALSPVRSDRHTLWQALTLALACGAWQCVWL